MYENSAKAFIDHNENRPANRKMNGDISQVNKNIHNISKLPTAYRNIKVVIVFIAMLHMFVLCKL